MTRKVKRGNTLSDMLGTGDPYEMARMEEDGDEPTYHRQADVEDADKALRERIDRADAEAARMGISAMPWWQEGAEEYHYGPEGPPKGLPDNIKNEEYQRGQRAFNSVSRQELDHAKADHWAMSQWAEDLYDDYLDSYGSDASPEEVAAAAQRVTERYRVEGSRDIARKISKNREAFLDDVYTEVVVGSTKHSGDANRTMGLGSFGGRPWSGGPMRESDDEPMSSMISEVQKKSGYY